MWIEKKLIFNKSIINKSMMAQRLNCPMDSQSETGKLML